MDANIGLFFILTKYLMDIFSYAVIFFNNLLISKALENM